MFKDKNMFPNWWKCDNLPFKLFKTAFCEEKEKEVCDGTQKGENIMVLVGLESVGNP